MAFQTPLTIVEVIRRIVAREYVLPAIQRELVWKPDQIELLFDSLLRGYPIGSFLFWKIEKERAGEYQFYDFIYQYHERDGRHNQPLPQISDRAVTAVLDGQQRLTALYLGLLGSYAEKRKHARINNPDAYPNKQLHLRLDGPIDLEAPEGDGRLFDVRFLGADELAAATGEHWLLVKEVYHATSQLEIMKLLQKQGLADSEFAVEAAFRLYQLIHITPLINYYLEEDQDLDKVLNIFIRVNSGGTQLSYSDLLLSTATAQWDTIDARREIFDLVDELNQVGQGFSFNRDFVLKSCLVLADISSIRFKVDNFTKANLGRIEGCWEDIKKALRDTAVLLDSFGFSRETLTSLNAVIPIAYYLSKVGATGAAVTGPAFAAERARIREWLLASLIKQAFGGQSDDVIRACREVIQQNPVEFPTAHLMQRFRQLNKSLTFTDEDLLDLTERRYRDPDSFMLLSLLYPSFDYKNHFHLDHIHPRSLCTRSKLSRRGLSETQVTFIAEHLENLPNLQLLPGQANQEKSAKPFQDWLSQQGDQTDYRQRHYIPNASLELADFREFYEARQRLLIKALGAILPRPTSRTDQSS